MWLFDQAHLYMAQVTSQLAPENPCADHAAACTLKILTSYPLTTCTSKLNVPCADARAGLTTLTSYPQLASQRPMCPALMEGSG